MYDLTRIYELRYFLLIPNTIPVDYKCSKFRSRTYVKIKKIICLSFIDDKNDVTCVYLNDKKKKMKKRNLY